MTRRSSRSRFCTSRSACVGGLLRLQLLLPRGADDGVHFLSLLARCLVVAARPQRTWHAAQNAVARSASKALWRALSVRHAFACNATPRQSLYGVDYLGGEGGIGERTQQTRCTG